MNNEDEMTDAEKIIAIVKLIPRLKVLTYGDISDLVYKRRNAGRAVGGVIKAYQNDPTVPWWAVVDAKLRPAKARSDEATKRLKAEGLTFCGNSVHEMHRWKMEEMPKCVCQICGLCCCDPPCHP